MPEAFGACEAAAVLHTLLPAADYEVPGMGVRDEGSGFAVWGWSLAWGLERRGFRVKGLGLRA